MVNDVTHPLSTHLSTHSLTHSGADLGFCRKGDLAGQVWFQVFEKGVFNQTIDYCSFFNGVVTLLLKWDV